MRSHQRKLDHFSKRNPDQKQVSGTKSLFSRFNGHSIFNLSNHTPQIPKIIIAVFGATIGAQKTTKNEFGKFNKMGFMWSD